MSARNTTPVFYKRMSASYMYDHCYQKIKLAKALGRIPEGINIGVLKDKLVNDPDVDLNPDVYLAVFSLNLKLNGYCIRGKNFSDRTVHDYVAKPEKIPKPKAEKPESVFQIRDGIPVGKRMNSFKSLKNARVSVLCPHCKRQHILTDILPTGYYYRQSPCEGKGFDRERIGFWVEPRFEKYKEEEA